VRDLGVSYHYPLPVPPFHRRVVTRPCPKPERPGPDVAGGRFRHDDTPFTGRPALGWGALWKIPLGAVISGVPSVG
jgi:hypothetical protein